MKRYAVFLTEDAARDLEELHDYIVTHDAPERAAYVLDQLEGVIATLSEVPGRGAYPKELLVVGVREYREVFFKPYRIIYRVVSDRVYVVLIADGRREMRTLLQRRVLRP